MREIGTVVENKCAKRRVEEASLSENSISYLVSNLITLISSLVLNFITLISFIG